MDIYDPEKRSNIMSKIKGKGTKLEEKGWQLLRDAGLQFRKHPKGIPGNPDAANKSRKIAVFFDSEFWHGYDWKNRKENIKSNKKFWTRKIERNIERDKEVTAELKAKGWAVIRIWEKELNKKNLLKTIEAVKRICKQKN